MGMPVAFNPTNADFRNMLPLPQGAYVNAFIDFVLHNSYVKVDEEGTEAAAVTVIGMAGTVSLDPNRPPTFYMRVDRPFFFAIVDNVSDTILFMGSIVDPLGK